MHSHRAESAANLRFMLRALRHRNYRLFFSGQVISLVGTWLSMVASSWLVYRLATAEGRPAALLLGLVAFAGQFPLFVLTPLTGVWIDTPRGEAKICAIGVKINVRAVTKHGFALNVNTDMRFFDAIIPCGIPDRGVTSMAEVLSAPVDEAAVSDRIAAHFGDIFGLEMAEGIALSARKPVSE